MPKKPKSLNFQFWRYTTNLDLQQQRIKAAINQPAGLLDKDLRLC